MFRGQECTYRCRNSINILRRQEKAKKLNTCICDGTENYDCKAIHRHMKVLCFGKGRDYNTAKKTVDEKLLNKINRAADGIPDLINGTMLATIILLLLFTR